MLGTCAPTSVKDMMAWPSHAVGQMDDDAKCRLSEVLAQGVHVNTAYSGIDAPGMSLKFLADACRSVGLLPPHSPHPFMHSAACDCKPSAQQVLMNLEPPCKPEHCFEDLQGLVRPCVLSLLNSFEAPPTASLDDKRSAFDSMVETLEAYEERGKLWARASPCVMHGRSCSHSDGHTAADGKISLHLAGTICKDFSRMRRGRVGVYGASGKALLIWLFHRRCIQEDLIVQECTPEFPVALLERFLGEFYDIQTLQLGPEDLAWPIRRKRHFAFCVKKSGSMAFVGSWTDFMAGWTLPRGACKVVGDDLFLLSPEAVAADLKANLAGRADSQFGAEATWSDLMSGSMHSRKESYKQTLLAGNGYHMDELRKCTSQDLTEMIRKDGLHAVVDLEQSPSWRGLLRGGVIPCVISHGMLWSLSLDRPMLLDELFLCMGMPYGRLKDVCAFAAPWTEATFRGLNDRQIHDLVGNSIHVPMVGTPLAYFLSNLVNMRATQLTPVDADSMCD